MKIVAIIPARGGSKGIPGKNMRSVAGKPLFAWSVEQARQTPRISRVFVSTDSHEITVAALAHGAEVIARPADISGDTASSESCLVHALDHLRAKEHVEPDLVVFLQPTSPLRAVEDIQKAITTLESLQADSLFSACRVEGFVWRVEKDGTVCSFSYDHENRPRRQDAPEDLIENGSIYIFRPWVLRKFNNRLGGKIAIYRMPAIESFQIDEPADLELIETLMAYRMRTISASEQQTAQVRCQFQAPNFPLASIRLLVLDFDGVLTDNRVLVSEDGKESVLCSRGDGFGIGLLKAAGVEVIVISKERNPVVIERCRKLGLECVHGCEDKLAKLIQISERRKLKSEAIAYMGNDLNDLGCMRWVGLPIAVADAEPTVLSNAQWVTRNPGGHGAVREVCDVIVGARPEGPIPAASANSG